jgi:hypothetical protein
MKFINQNSKLTLCEKKNAIAEEKRLSRQTKYPPINAKLTTGTIMALLQIDVKLNSPKYCAVIVPVVSIAENDVMKIKKSVRNMLLGSFEIGDAKIIIPRTAANDNWKLTSNSAYGLDNNINNAENERVVSESPLLQNRPADNPINDIKTALVIDGEYPTINKKLIKNNDDIIIKKMRLYLTVLKTNVNASNKILTCNPETATICAMPLF